MIARYVVIALAVTMVVLGLLAALTGCDNSTMQANPNEYSQWHEWATTHEM
jgi:hypothetical protein